MQVVALVPKASSGLEAGAEGASDGPSSGASNPGPPAVLAVAPGWIEPAPHALGVPALGEGVVREVLVLEGDRVEAGQVVLRMVDEDALLAVRAAEAAAASRLADIERADAAVIAASGQVAAEEALLAGLADEIERKQPLAAAGGVTAAELRELEFRRRAAEARVAAAEAVVKEAQASVRQAKAAMVVAETALEESRLRLRRMEVAAPAAGVVLARLVEPGYRVTMAAKHGEGAGGVAGAVMTLYDPKRLQVRADVPIADAATIGVGTRALVTTEALPDKEFAGVVTRVLHEANIQRNTIQCKIALEDPSPILKPEMLVRVRFMGHRSVGASAQASSDAGGAEDGLLLLLPSEAIASQQADRAVVWLVDASTSVPVARRREIVVGPADDRGYMPVREGLRLTDRVIVDRPPTLREGDRVNVLGERPSWMPAAAPR